MNEITAKTPYQAQLFFNRISKQYKNLKKWARKNRISCYRLYDRDIPEIPLALDLYTFLPDEIEDKIEAALFINEINTAISQNSKNLPEILKNESSRTYAHLYLYERPYEKDENEEKEWLKAMAESASKALGIEENHVIIKTRKKQSDGSGKREQYEKLESERKVQGLVMEQGQIFKVNLSDYIDTGLFFDHRPLRSVIRNECSGKSVLNLFCYTGSFSVYCAEGKAKRVQSVDMSNTYLDWAKENMILNGFSDENRFIYTRGDCVGFLNQMNAEVENPEGSNRFDIIILDPPTFSNSKRTSSALDINRDWPLLVSKCLSILKPHGTVYFSTNSRRLIFDSEKLKEIYPLLDSFEIKDLTSSTIPEDYRNCKIHRVWSLIKK